MPGAVRVLSAQPAEPMLFWDRPAVDSGCLVFPELILRMPSADTVRSRLHIVLAHEILGQVLVVETTEILLGRRNKIDLGALSYCRTDTVQPFFFDFLKLYKGFPMGKISATFNILVQDTQSVARLFEWEYPAPLKWSPSTMLEHSRISPETTGRPVASFRRIDFRMSPGLFPVYMLVDQDYLPDSTGSIVLMNASDTTGGSFLPLFTVCTARLSSKNLVIADSSRSFLWKMVPESDPAGGSLTSLPNVRRFVPDEQATSTVSNLRSKLTSMPDAGIRGDLTLETEQYSRSPYADEIPLSVYRAGGNATLKLGIFPFQLGFLVTNEQTHFYKPNQFYYRFDRDLFKDDMRNMRQSLISVNTQEIQGNKLLTSQLAAQEELIKKRIAEKQEELTRLGEISPGMDSLSWSEEVVLQEKKQALEAKLKKLRNQESGIREKLDQHQQRTRYDSSYIKDLFPEGAEDQMSSRDIRQTLKKTGKLNPTTKILSGLLDFEFGQVYRSYSRYSLANIGVSGATIGYDFNRTDVYVLHGQMLSNNHPLSAGFPGNAPNVTALKLVYKHQLERKSSFVILDASATAPTNRMPQRKNTVVSVGYENGPEDKTKVNYELSATINGLTKETESVSTLLYNALLDPDRYAGFVRVRHEFEKLSVEGSYEQVNSGFYSVGNLFQRRNFREITSGVVLENWNGQWKNKMLLKYLRNDLSRKNDALGLVLDSRLSVVGWPSVEVYYSPYFIENQVYIGDSVQFIRNSHAVIRGASRFSRKKGRQMHSAMVLYQKSLVDFDQEKFSTEQINATYAYKRGGAVYSLLFQYSRQAEIYTDTAQARMALIPARSITAGYSVQFLRYFTYTAEAVVSPDVSGSFFGAGSGLSFSKNVFRLSIDWHYRSDASAPGAMNFHLLRARLNASF